MKWKIGNISHQESLRIMSILWENYVIFFSALFLAFLPLLFSHPVHNLLSSFPFSSPYFFLLFFHRHIYWVSPMN